jgi:5'-deoxynucleotidase YfbR-like HD superfamily hydrolase
MLAGFLGAERLHAIWTEFTVGETPEARLAHAIDKLELALQAWAYRDALSDAETRELIAWALDRVVSPALQPIAEMLRLRLSPSVSNGQPFDSSPS